MALILPELFIGERILVRQIPNKLPYCIHACYVKEHIINDNNSMIIKIKNDIYNIKFILGIINSKLISFWFEHTFAKNSRKIFPQFKVKELSLFPIIKLDEKNLELQNKIIGLVDNIIILNEKLILEKNPNSITIINRQINALDKQIDALVYKLYNLNDEEIKIIEGN